MANSTLEIIYKGISLHLSYFLKTGEEKTILYLHGGACSKNDFADSLNVSGLQTYTLVSYDYPGCGNSPYPDTATFTIDDLVEITKLFISQLNLKNLYLIGHSTGGMVALKYILKYGQNVKGFISVEGNVHSDNCKFSRKVILQSLQEFKDKGIKELLTKLKTSGNKGFQIWAQTIESTASAKAFYDMCPSLVKYCDDKSLIEKYCKLLIPKLYIYGSQNIDSFSFLEYFKTNNCCELVEIAGSAHFPFYDNPEEYYKVLSTFVNKL